MTPGAVSSAVPAARRPDMLAAALALAARGFRLVPLHSVTDAGACSCPKGAACGKSAGKHPRPAQWQREASSNPAIVRSWWERWPASNIGLVMGGEPRLVALDVDGAEGRATLARLEATHGPLPVTLASRSGREDGGEHRFFRVPPEYDLSRIPNGVGRARGSAHPGIDVRAEGGQIVAPPSMHYTGRRYQWTGAAGLATPIAPLPGWLFELLAAPREHAGELEVDAGRPGLAGEVTGSTGARDVSQDDRERRARAYLARIEGAVEGEHGGTATFLAAQKIGRGFDLDAETTFRLLLEDFNPRCRPPWEPRDLRRKVREAFDKGTMEIGSLLDAPLPAHLVPPASPARPAPPVARSREVDELERAEREAIVMEPSVMQGQGDEPALGVEAVLGRVLAASKGERNTVARAEDVLDFAAGLDERSPAWRTLYDGLRGAGVKLLAWRDDVRARRAGSTAAALAHGGEEERPRIVITTDERAVSDAAIEALSRGGRVYQRGTMLVDVVREPTPDGSIRRPGGSHIRPVPLPRLREELSAVARWMTVRTAEDGRSVERPAHPPEWAVRAVAARGMWTSIQPLNAVVECPVLRPDGSILDKPGYDERTGILYAPSGAFPPVPARPSHAEALAARDALLDVVCDFPFAGDVDRAAWLAGLLTPLARHAFEGNAPMFLVSGNVRAAGKGKLVSVIAHIVTGRGASSFSQVDDENEERKRITSIALAGDPLVLIDNINRPFGSGTFDKALTDTVWSERLLGQNEAPRLPLFCTWYGTGNNVAFASRCDTARRCAIIRIVSPDERPEDRADFRYPDLLAHVAAERPRLLVAALTILRGWVVAGMRPAPGAPPLLPWGSFEAWSRIVGGAIAWVGLPDPGKARGARDDDTEAAALAELLEGWAEAAAALAPERHAVSAAVVLAALLENDQERAAVRHPYKPPPERFATLRSALAQLVPGVPVGKLPNAMQVGHLLKRYHERPIGGRALRYRMSRGERLWMITQIAEGGPLS